MQPFLFNPTAWLDYLKDRLLPIVLAQARGQRQVLRIWSVGCQTGDEAAVLALALQALLGDEMEAWQIRIFATDADSLAPVRARQRVYSHLPTADRYWQDGLPTFAPTSGGYRLAKALYGTIIFAPHDLLYQPPFPHLDLIVCHIPLADRTLDEQAIVFNRFAYALAAHRYLWLVAPGTVFPDPGLWQCPDANWQLYRRTPCAIPPRCLRWKRASACIWSARSSVAIAGGFGWKASRGTDLPSPLLCPSNEGAAVPERRSNETIYPGG